MDGSGNQRLIHANARQTHSPKVKRKLLSDSLSSAMLGPFTCYIEALCRQAQATALFALIHTLISTCVENILHIVSKTFLPLGKVS